MPRKKIENSLENSVIFEQYYGNWSLKDYMKAIEEEPFVILFIPQENQTREMWLAAVSGDGCLLADAPSAYRHSADFCQASVESSNGASLELIPQKYRTHSIIIGCLSLDGMTLRFLDEKERTKEYCRYAVLENGEALQYVPENLKRCFYRLAVMRSGRALRFVPRHKITPKMADRAIATNPLAYEFLPYTFRNEERTLEALKGSYKVFQFVPEALKNREFFLKAIANCPEVYNNAKMKFNDATFTHEAIKENGLVLKYLPREDITSELCTDAISANANSIFYVPRDLLTNRMVLDALHSEGGKGNRFAYLYASLHEDLKTLSVKKELSVLTDTDQAMTQSRDTLNNWVNDHAQGNLIPNEKLIFNDKTKSLERKKARGAEHVIYAAPKASKHLEGTARQGSLFDKDDKGEAYITYTPPEISATEKHIYNYIYNIFRVNTPITDEEAQFLKAVQENGLAIQDIPEKKLTREICEAAVQQNGLAIRYIPKNHITQELCDLAFTQNSNVLPHIDRKYKTLDMCMTALERNGNILEFIPQEFKTKDLYAKLIDFHPEMLYAIPLSCVTQDMCVSAVKRVPETIRSVPNEFLDEKIICMAVKQNPSVANLLPESVLTDKVQELLSEKGNTEEQVYSPAM